MIATSLAIPTAWIRFAHALSAHAICVYTAHTHSFLDVTRDVPAHFLCRQQILNLPDGFDENGEEEFDVSVAQSNLCRQLYHLNSTLKLFWRCWRVEYLSELRNAHHYHGGKADAILPSVAEVVIVKDEDRLRTLWELARITSLITAINKEQSFMFQGTARFNVLYSTSTHCHKLNLFILLWIIPCLVVGKGLKIKRNSVHKNLGELLGWLPVPCLRTTNVTDPLEMLSALKWLWLDIVCFHLHHVLSLLIILSFIIISFMYCKPVCWPSLFNGEDVGHSCTNLIIHNYWSCVLVTLL